MNFQKYKEVRKRRAKVSTTRPKVYQMMLLGVIGLALSSLAIGKTPQFAPILVSGVAGGMMMLFLILQSWGLRREAKIKTSPQEALPTEKEFVEPQPIPSMAEGKIIDDSLDSISKSINSGGPREIIFPELEDAATPHLPPSMEKEELIPLHELSRAGVLAHNPARLARLDLEEKVASCQEGQSNPEPKIDLQTILSHLDEEEEKVAQPSIRQ